MIEYKNYLFDADGTLIDTIELIVQSFTYSCRKYGDIVPERGTIIKDIGRPLSQQIELYLGKLTKEKKAEILQEFRSYQLNIYQKSLTAFDNVQQTLAKLKSAGKKLAIVTSRKSDTAIIYLKHVGIFDFFDAIVTPESTDEHKPNPQPAFKALELLEGDPKYSVFIGDSYFDIKCGQQAGMDTIFVSWSHNDPREINPGPTFIIDDMTELYA